MYNFRTYPDLGLGRAAARRIPCGCTRCIELLEKPWQAGVPAEEQERYKGSEKCKFWSISRGLHDWTLLTLTAGANTNEDEIEKTMEVALRGIAAMMAEKIEVGEYNAFMTDNLDPDGYYFQNGRHRPTCCKTIYG
jgi:hypothetical protein